MHVITARPCLDWALLHQSSLDWAVAAKVMLWQSYYSIFELFKPVNYYMFYLWFASYLHEMTHSVKIDKIMSESKSYLYRVPHGSILAPIHFNIFLNDILKINSLPEITTSTTIYADDVQLLFSGSPNNLEQLKIYAETSLKTMKQLYSENGLKMN